MSAWIDAFLPTFALIALGAALRARMLREDLIWAGLEVLTFRILLPALLAQSISRLHLSELPVGGLAGTIWTTLILATGSAIAIARGLGHDRAAMTSIVQGGIRFNTYIALAISVGLYGPAGLAFGGVTAGLIVPCAQTILTLVFVLSDDKPVSPLRIVAQTLLNPLLLGCLVGFAFAALGGMPPGVDPFAKTLGAAGLALGLLCVGAGLRLNSLREEPLTQALVAVQKLVAVPAVTFGLAKAFGLDHLSTAVAVLTMAMPTATTAYVQARAMGGDAPLMATIITFQHVAAVITLPIWAMVLL